MNRKFIGFSTGDLGNGTCKMNKRYTVSDFLDIVSVDGIQRTGSTVRYTVFLIPLRKAMFGMDAE